MSTLAVNGWRILGRRTGVGRYLHNIVRYWTPDLVARRFDRIRFYTSRPLDENTLLPATVESAVLGPDSRMILWENARLGPSIDDDVLWGPSHSLPIVTRAKTVVTMHDATPVLHPELFPRSVGLFYNRLYELSVRRATLVITDAEAAKEDILRCWDVDPAKIRVVPMGAEDVFQPLPEADRAENRTTQQLRYFGSATPYFLVVGKLSGRRSVPLLFESFARFKQRTGQPHKLLVVGMNIHNIAISDLLEQARVKDDVVHVSWIDDAELNRLYNGAEALVSPAIYEVVCLPVNEAMATGTPVVCVDTPGLRETTGGQAVLVNGATVDAFAAGFERIAADPAGARELGERGRAYRAPFTWRRCSAETLAVLAEAAER